MGGATNVLDPSALLHTITQSVPNALQTPYDALAAATHAMMLAVGFRFAGLGDDARQGRVSYNALRGGWGFQKECKEASVRTRTRFGIGMKNVYTQIGFVI